jgi:hypothetical protein
MTRRNIVYNLYATFNLDEELPLIFDELLEPLNLRLETCDNENMLESISGARFDTFLSFIYAFEVLLKQMGAMMLRFLPKLTTVLVRGVFNLSKLF